MASTVKVKEKQEQQAVAIAVPPVTSSTEANSAQNLTPAKEQGVKARRRRGSSASSEETTLASRSSASEVVEVSKHVEKIQDGEKEVADTNSRFEISSLTEQKSVAYYSALLTAWCSARIEQDKTIIALSSAGVGLLVTIESQVASVYNIISCSIGVASFIIAIVLSFISFGRSANHVEATINEDEDAIKKTGQEVNDVDKFARFAFVVGLLMTMVTGIVVGVTKIMAQEKQGVSNKSQPTSAVPSINKIEVREGLNGINRLRPPASPQEAGKVNPKPNNMDTKQPKLTKVKK